MPYQKLNRILIVSLLPLLVWGLSACGGDEAESSSPAEATVAIEATAEAPAKTEGETAAAPTTATEAEPGDSEQAIELGEPASLMEAAEAIDLREMPTLSATASMGEPEVGSLSYQSSEKIPAVLDFYRPKLVELGWQELPEMAYLEEAVGQLYFTKGDFMLYLGASQMGEDQVMVSLINHGNVDVRALPVYSEAETIYGDSPTSSIYATPAKVAEVVEFTRKELAALGWQEYLRPNTSYADDPNQQSLSFIQNGLELSAFIAVAPAQDGKTTAQYSVRVLSHELPVMAEASQLQFDEHMIYVSYIAPDNAEAVLNFYREKLTGMGYEEAVEAQVPDDSLLFTNDEMPLLLTVPANSAGQTEVVLRRLEAEELAALTGTAEEDVEAPAEVEPAGDEMAEAGLSAFNLPSPADATAVDFDADLEEITVTSPSDIKTLVEFYREALPAQGWQEEEMFAMVEENIGSLMFEQGEASLNMTLFNDGFSGETEISISASGLAWGDTDTQPTEAGSPDEEDPTAMEGQTSFTINDWPIPAEAVDVEIKEDEVSYVIDWDFQAVTDFYAPTFEEWGLGDSCLEFEPGFSSFSCSTGSSEISMSMNMFDNFDDMTEISFTFFGLAPAEVGDGASAEPAELSLIDEEGVPVPNDFDSFSNSSSQFVQELGGYSAATVTDLVSLYRSELPAQGWTEQADAGETGDDQATLAFEKPESLLIITMSGSGDQTELTLKHKLVAEAEKMGIIPPAGQSRLYMGNMHTEEVTVTINGQATKVAPTDPDAGPEDTMFLDLQPGQHSYTLSIPGLSDQEDSVELGAGESWMMVIGPDGAFALQVY